MMPFGWCAVENCSIVARIFFDDWAIAMAAVYMCFVNSSTSSSMRIGTCGPCTDLRDAIRISMLLPPLYRVFSCVASPSTRSLNTSASNRLTLSYIRLL